MLSLRLYYSPITSASINTACRQSNSMLSSNEVDLLEVKFAWQSRFHPVGATCHACVAKSLSCIVKLIFGRNGDICCLLLLTQVDF